MKVAGKAAGTAAILLAAVAGKAWAFGPFSNTQVCGGTAFVTCATLTTTYDASTNTLTLQIANTSANGDRFTAFGVRGLPDGITVTGTPDPGLASDWSFAADVPQLGGDPDGSAVKYSGFGTNQGINGAIANDGNTYTFVFTFSGAVDVNTLEFALHSQGGPNGCSTKMFIDETTSEVNTLDPNCGSTTVIPEPLTMTLLATGLAGMGGAGALRRRRKS